MTKTANSETNQWEIELDGGAETMFVTIDGKRMSDASMWYVVVDEVNIQFGWPIFSCTLKREAVDA